MKWTPRLPGAVRRWLGTEVEQSARNPERLLTDIDDLITRNELALGRSAHELETLEALELEEAERVRSGALPERAKKSALRRIQRLRQQMDDLEERQRIYTRNIRFQTQLIGRVRSLDAMRLRGLDDEAVSSIAEDYESELAQFQASIDAQDGLMIESDFEVDDRQELASLEAEILGNPGTTTRGAVAPSSEADTPVERTAETTGSASRWVAESSADDGGRA